MTVAELAAHVGGTVEGNAGDLITGVAALRDAVGGDLSFLANPKYAPLVAATRATAVLVAGEWTGEHTATLIRVPNPDRAFAQLVPLFAPPPVIHPPGVHATAVVGEGAILGHGVSVGPYVVVGCGCRIGARCVLEAHVVLGEGCVLGDDCHLYPHVSVRERIRMGQRVTIHNGSVIGSDGYGYSVTTGADGRPVVEKVPQLGTVEVGDDVEIGANVTIDRARFGATRIGNGVKIDNLVQIAHNVQIGESSGIIAQVGISGSTRVGRGAILWGQAGIAGHLDIGDGAQVFAQAGVSKDVPAGAMVVGSPAADRREAVKTFALPRTVDRLKARLEALEAEVAALRASKS
jgi:UDP-3-O-[3-hydroxymyristoyl] glucosamine N-acyltransferase